MKNTILPVVTLAALAVSTLNCKPSSSASPTTEPSPTVVSTADATVTFRPPAVPLVTHDPYFSVWSGSDRLTDSGTHHWTGKAQNLSSLLRVDGKTYRLMGDTPSALPTLEQTSLEVLPTRTIYTFTGAGVKLTLTFTSPLLPDDLDLLSRPVTYVTWDVVATDGKTHDASLYLDASAALAVDQPDQEVTWSREKVGDLTALKIGSTKQDILKRKGDDLRIDWGYFYLSAGAKDASFALGNNGTLESAFTDQGKLPGSDDSKKPRKVNDGDPVAAVTFALGQVGATPVSRYAMLAYDDLYSIQYIGKNLRPYWRRNGADANSLLKTAASEYDTVQKRCIAFDSELSSDMEKVGGKQYAQLASLAYRQAFAAQKLVADSKGQPLSFSKENFSNGCIATVDLIYPAGPQMIALSPSLLKASLQPILMYGASSYWKFPFAPHDLGTYPLANGQVYGDGERGENNQMPVEESGNLILLVAALAKVEGNTKFCDPFWPTLTKWTDYLTQQGFDPANQLCTDDFAGHMAHNVNLSAKAIMAIGAYADLAKMRGDTAAATKYRGLAETFAAQWMAASKEENISRLAFDRPGTWSQKYNMVWDSILEMKLFPQSTYDQEVAYYKSKLNPYGLPLDNRADYTKLDWTVWTATLSGKREDFDMIMTPVYTWMNTTPSRVPLTDWYDTKTGKQSGFQARTAVGGVFLPLLKDTAIWQKWTGRDKKPLTGWATLPKRPVWREIVATGQTKTDVMWQYTTDKPADSWFEVGFNDKSWKTGAAGFGTPDTPSIRVKTEWRTNDIWLRREFDWNASSTNDGTSVRVFGFHDEDTQVYLNGKLIGTLPGYNTSYEELLSIPAGLLKPGKNVFALHCHQTGGGQGIDIGIAELEKEK